VPTDAQVAAVQQYLTQAGFTNVQVAKNRMLVTADGTAAMTRAAFNTSLVQFNDAGRQVYANSGDAQVPAALSEVVDAVLGLQNVVTKHCSGREQEECGEGDPDRPQPGRVFHALRRRQHADGRKHHDRHNFRGRSFADLIRSADLHEQQLARHGADQRRANRPVRQRL
jgi:hypothetical protein